MGNLDYMDKINDYSNVSIAERVIADMRTHATDPAVIETGLVALWILGINQKNKRKLFKYGAHKAVLKAIKDHPTEEVVLASAFCAIKNLKIQLYDFAIRENGAKEILKAMKRFPNNAKLQEHACSAIKALGASERTSEHLISIGFPILVLHAMKNHKYYERLQKAACAAVWALCLTEKNKQQLWDLGLGHYIIEAMRNHPKMERLQEYACGTLWTFEYPYCMMRLYAHETVLAAMTRFKKNTSIISSGCGLIRKYASLKANAEELLLKEAPLVIIECLKHHPRESVLQETGCMAIWSLGIVDSNKEGLMEQGAQEFLVKLVLLYKKNAKVFATACGAITNLSTVDRHAELFLTDGVGVTVVEGAKLHPNSLQVQQNALSAIKNFAFVWNQEHIKAIKAAGIEELVQSAFRNFPDNDLIRKRGNEIIQKIS